MRSTCWIALCLPNLALAAWAAEPQPAVSDTVVVTANRVAISLAESIQQTTVITQQAISDSGALDVLSLLRREAGFEAYQTGGIGSQSSVFMRGTESDHTLVLVDGVRIGSATTGLTALDQIVVDQIDRIEIVRGNVSSLYGSEAIGGVIQIFTKAPRGQRLASAHIGVGTDNTQKLAATFSAGAERTKFGLSASGLKTDGFSAIRPQFIPLPFVTSTSDNDRDGYRNLSLSAKLSHEIAGGHELGAQAFHSDGRIEFDGVFQNSSKPKLTSWSIFSRNQLNERWLSRVSLSQGIDDLDSFLDGVEVSRFKTISDQFGWQNEIAIDNNQRIAAGFEYLRQRIESSESFRRTRRTATSLYGSYFGSLGPHTLQINLRHDDFSDVGGKTTGLLGYGYQVSKVWRVTAAASTAFKAPTFNELYFPFFGNPELRPERARSAEIGFHYSDGPQFLKAVYFVNRISDLISLRQATPVSFLSVNVDRSKIDGLEVSYTANFGDTQAQASVTLQEPVDRTTGAQLLRRAKAFGALSLRRTLGSWRVGGELRATGRRVDIPIDAVTGDERVNLAGYALVNLTARYRFDRATELGLRIENVFDRDYQVAHGYHTQGRGAVVTLNHTWD